ncbi:G-alpha-domain-containing protein [Schizopora paradoxa]|uniref:G-alpha-domain-containing protein n=1 Tax=Schizopora paradoxa TaxID=27342 RepID=A0A0H2S4E2_9AGAM|nr:G-alpha-domain-containing protein [Schizopora paradoxa]
MGITADADPFALALRPPADETPEERDVRLQAEAEAKRRSDEIDSMLQAEALSLKKRQKREIRVLLLGQGESGKSTTLKNFQLSYAQRSWAAEKSAWRVVIQLNVVRSVNFIAAAVEKELEAYKAAIAGEVQELDPDADVDIDNDIEAGTSSAEGRRASTPSTFSSQSLFIGSNPAAKNLVKKADELTALIARLKPLYGVQRALERMLGREGTDEACENAPVKATNGFGIPKLKTRRSTEFFVRTTGWKDTLTRFQAQMRSRSSTGSSTESPTDVRRDQVGAKLANCSSDMIALWGDSAVREFTGKMSDGLGDEAEFFLGNIARIVDPLYAPTDEDVIRARLRTMGVQEHRIKMENGPYQGREWVVYDVGGARSQRAQWAKYFSAIHAIIFLAPISAFDQHLHEDRRVNRLDDTVQLWKQVCSNKLIQNTEIVVFLNKQDLLARKLASGIRFSSWVRNYRGAEDAESVSNYLKTKFTDIFRQSQRPPSSLHMFFTSVVDTKATSITLVAVQDGILKNHLSDLDLI